MRARMIQEESEKIWGHINLTDEAITFETGDWPFKKARIWEATYRKIQQVKKIEAAIYFNTQYFGGDWGIRVNLLNDTHQVFLLTGGLFPAKRFLQDLQKRVAAVKTYAE